MFEQKSNGAKWRELSGAVDAAAPQALPTQPSEGRTPIAELVIADIRARAEAGVRKYGAPLHANNGRSALVDLYQELLDGAQYARQEIEEREASRAMAPEGATAEVWRSLATSSHAEATGAVLLPLLDALGWDEARGEPEGPIEYARRMRSDAVQGATFLGALAEIRGVVGPKDDEKTIDAVRRKFAAAGAEVESLKAGLRALADIRDEGAAETARWRDRALVAERDAERRTEEVGLWRTRALEAESTDRAAGDALFAKSVALVEQVEALRTAVRAARARARAAEEHRDELSAEAQARGVERDQARMEIERVSAAWRDDLAALSEESKALRGERDDLLAQMAAKTRETEDVRRERDALAFAWAQGEKLGATRRRAQAVEARAAALEGERLAQAVKAARYKAMLNEDENDPATPCRCGQFRGACRSCLMLGIYKAEDVASDVRAALKAAGVDTDEMAPEELGGVVVEKLDELAAKADEVETLKAERARAEHEASRSDNALTEIEAAVTHHLEPLIDKEERGSAERVIIEAASTIQRARERARLSGNEAMNARDRFEAYRAEVARARADHLAPRVPKLANEIRDGSAEVAPSAPVEAPQAAETLDPGEGWRLLGSSEVIAWGDECWSPISEGWGADDSLVGAPAAWWPPGVRRRIAAPVAPASEIKAATCLVCGAPEKHRAWGAGSVQALIATCGEHVWPVPSDPVAPASAPAVEPVTEVAIEARGTKFVIVRRQVAP